MRVELEDFVPYDQSVLWRLGQAYYAGRGIAAWTEDDVPFEGTNNAAFARQHADFFAAIAPDGPVDVLEVGAGVGRFAPNFLRALREGHPGLFGRVRYVLSDVADRNLREAAATHALREHVAAGRVVPAVFDLRDPGPRGLDGQALTLAPVMVVASYVCDVTPVALFRKSASGFEERYVRALVEVAGKAPPREALVQALIDRSVEPGSTVGADIEWRRVDPDSRLPADQAAALRALVSGLSEATVPWFGLFLDLVARLRSIVRPGGVLVVNDYGGATAEDLEGLGDPTGNRYGNASSHPVNFAAFDAFCGRLGLPVLRTRERRRALHTAAIVYGSADHAQAFRRAFVESRSSEDFLDFLSAGHVAAQAGQFVLAIRMYERALALDPSSPELHHRLGEAAAEIGWHDDALAWLSRGQALDGEGARDFDFPLGRVLRALGRHDDAIAAFHRSLRRADQPPARYVLALVHADLGDFATAASECRAALGVDADFEPARALLVDVERALARASG